MPSNKPPGSGRSKTVNLNTQNGEAFIQKKGSAARETKQFESALATDIIAELYPLLLENCMDEDDEVDTRAVSESLAGLVGLFVADYREGYGDEKAMAAFQDLVDLALNVYEERSQQEE